MSKIFTSPFPDVEIPDDVSLPTYLLEKFRHYGDEKAMVCAKTDRYVTYREIIETTLSLVAGFQKISLSKGKVFCACLVNCFEYVPVSLAVTSLGAIFATANPDYTEVGDVIHYNTLLKNTTARIVNDVNVNPKTDVAFYVSSSGTTGMPKTVMLTHYNIIALLRILTHSVKGDLRQYATGKNEICSTIFQYCNIGGIVCSLYRALQEGSTCVGLFPKFQSRLFLESLEKYKVNVVVVAPSILVYWSKMPNKEKYNLSSISAILCGAAPLSIAVNNSTCNDLNLPFITEEYGLTETCGTTHMTPLCKLSQHKRGSCGMLVANTLCKIIDVDTGRLLGTNEVGEICVKGPHVTIGYLNNLKATSDTIDSDGWFHTGDVGYYDEDEYLYVVDRIKELIKVKGYQIYVVFLLHVAPAELENVLLSHVDVADAAVFGIPDEYSGERLCAYVVRKPNSVIMVEDLEQFVAEKVVGYKRLNGGIKFVREIPKSPSGKILRRFLKKEYSRTVLLTSRL